MICIQCGRTFTPENNGDGKSPCCTADGTEKGLHIIIGVCKEDNPADVDEAYGEGTYARLFPDEEEASDDE
jgi:D-Tyr-tRNAtyr deacylase